MKQRLVSASGTIALRSLLAVTAVFVAGLFAPASARAEGPVTSVSGYQAQVIEDASLPTTFIGFVLRDEDGNLATKVRAIGENGVVCGTASVITLATGDGFYRLDAVGAESREGCPSEGGALAFRLLYGMVDSGEFALTSEAVRFASGETVVISLTTNPDDSTANWLGDVPTSSGEFGLLTWIGTDGTPTGDALASVGVSVDRAVHYDGDLGRWVSYTVGGAMFRQTFATVSYGDVVLVRVQ